MKLNNEVRFIVSLRSLHGTMRSHAGAWEREKKVTKKAATTKLPHPALTALVRPCTSTRKNTQTVFTESP